MGVLVGEGRWLRIGQVAEILGVHTNTARNYADTGKFRRVRRLAGGDRRIWSEDVESYLREMEAEPERDQGASPQQ
ncbi:helix-turn-helix domain-containing protein [Micromonospora sp. WMMD1102]|uniref:helix-turn-helix domain-containing protein n=1 Tax=Micromonospora sp. WMMD1102 TaxID=3016105 RepID=UPI0024153F56|nr:helix-turn-helix domain-containing protein [Micromonospora sp. WMMD1102]MDG4792041.1 helix-turn-helix domain-containing protein [Micromonospora sp. WMMD1102]